MSSNDALIALSWMVYTIIYFETGRTLAKIARRVSGSPLQWLVPGRWLLAASYLVMMVPFLDVARIRTEPKWLEPHWSSDPSSWSVVILRFFPIPFLVWTLFRMRRQGLVNDEPKPRTVSEKALERSAVANEEQAASMKEQARAAERQATATEAIERQGSGTAPDSSVERQAVATEHIAESQSGSDNQLAPGVRMATAMEGIERQGVEHEATGSNATTDLDTIQ